MILLGINLLTTIQKMNTDLLRPTLVIPLSGHLCRRELLSQNRFYFRKMECRANHLLSFYVAILELKYKTKHP